MIKAAVIDDELQSIVVLRSMLKKTHADVEIVATAYNVTDGVALLNEHAIDLLFLDIEMPDGTGFELLDQLKEIKFDVIFITAFNQYAIKAFRYAALDYLMKPIDSEQLADALSRVNVMHQPKSNERVNLLLENHKSSNKFQKLAVSTTEGVFYYNVDSLIRCEADGSYTTIIAEARKPIIASKSIKEYENILPDFFCRVHKSHLVNFNYIKKFESSDQPKLILKDNSSVVVSRRRKQFVAEKLSTLK